MKSALVFLSGLAGTAVAQGVTGVIPPPGSSPSGCSADAGSSFEITVARVAGATKRDLAVKKRGACGGEGILVLSLAGGVLKDAQGRTGYIAANRQFQFDAPPQAGAIYTAGYSVCGNGSLALGPSTTFYECLSGTFYNLYDQTQGGQCSPVQLIAMPCGGADPPGQASEGNDGQAIATQVITTTVVKPISDGQPQVITTVVPVPICQITDGQVQGGTTPCASLPAPTKTAAPVSQYSDGQIQVTGPPAPVTQISDGQVQATTGKAPVTQISDGQVQATTGKAPVTQISDGQVQATTGTGSPAPVTQISDGQVQATGSPAPVTQISDGQIQATATGTAVPPTTPAPVKNTTLSTSLSPTAPSSSSKSSPTPSTAPTSGASHHMEMASMAALVVGLVGAVLFI